MNFASLLDVFKRHSGQPGKPIQNPGKSKFSQEFQKEPSFDSQIQHFKGMLWDKSQGKSLNASNKAGWMLNRP